MSNPKDFNPFPDTDPGAPKDMPPLNVLSLSVRTIVNYQDNKREVLCATARFWNESSSFLDLLEMFIYKLLVQIDDPTPPELLKCTVHTFIRPLDQFPSNFERRAKASSNGKIMPMKNERMLLSSLLSKLPFFSFK